MRIPKKPVLVAGLGLVALLIVGGLGKRGGAAEQVLSRKDGLLDRQRVEPLSEPQAPSEASLTPAAPPNLEALFASQRLIRTGNLAVEVKAFEGALAQVQAIAAARGGYIADLRTQREEQGRARGTVVLRVLPAQYFSALDDLRALGRVESEAVQTQDITKAYADLESRLRNKRDVEIRMREILRTKTGKLSDLLEAERQLAFHGSGHGYPSDTFGCNSLVAPSSIRIKGLEKEIMAMLEDITP